MINLDKIKEELISVGGLYALTKRNRHPSNISAVESKGKGKDTFKADLVIENLEKALKCVAELGKHNSKILFVSSRKETLDLVEAAANDMDMPYVLGRWVGGTLSNFNNIKSRTERLVKLQKDLDSGEWDKFTKKERVLLGREMSKLETRFAGLVKLEIKPGALFVIDAKKESIAVTEAVGTDIKVIAFSNSDSDATKVDYPIIGNINSRKAVEIVLEQIKTAYKNGIDSAPAPAPTEEKK